MRCAFRLLLGAFLGVVSIASFACGPAAVVEPENEAGQRAEAPGIEVRTARIRRGPIVQRISAPGSIVARREARIGAEVQGRIVEVLVEEGDRVKAGDPLFQIDPKPFRLALLQAEAVLDRVRAERKQTEADLDRAGALQRKKVVSQEESDRIATGVAVALAQEREARQAVAIAERNLEHSLVRAPFDGSITRRLEDEGTTALVQPQTIVLILQETHVLEAVATIAETHFESIRKGDVALLHVDGLPLPIQTVVESVGDAIDVVSRTFRVKMPIANDDHRLKAGLFARVDILPQAKREVLLAPRESIRNLDGRTLVLVVRDDVVELAPIEIGLISENAVEVISGLRVDDDVVVGEEARMLAGGMRVRVRNEVERTGS